MQTYFPYSQIIANICVNVKRNIVKHTYTGDWQVLEKKTEPVKKPCLVAISELYY